MTLVGDVQEVAPPVDELQLIQRLRAGDEQAFGELVDAYYPLMLRVALGYVRSRAVAEEVVQDAWLGVLKGIERFEGRSSLKTWIVRIVLNRARTERDREARSIPFSSLGEDYEPAVEPDRFRPPDAPFPGHWWSYPQDWATLPEGALLSQETLDLVKAAIAELPEGQRNVITLRDIEGWSAEEVCNALDLSESNQRVLLHRARSSVRRVLERHFEWQ